MPNVLFVQGPTASGKSDLALELAEQLGGEIINCDSVQVYQRINIGAAKPNSDERARVPHHLIDIVEPGAEFTTGDYRRLAFEILEAPENKDKTFLFVGGTGFYFLALEKGMYPVIKVPKEIKAKVKEWSEKLSTEKLYAWLQEKDPGYAARVHANDKYRITRALELLETEGRTMGEIQAEFEREKVDFPFPLIKVGLAISPEDLRPRVEQRCEKMLQLGLREEVEGLLADGLRSWAPMRSVGYAETIDWIDGNLNNEEYIDRFEINTMQLAKKQRTWMKKVSGVNWLEWSDPNRVQKVTQLVQQRWA